MTMQTLEQIIDLLPATLPKVCCEPITLPTCFIDVVRPFSKESGCVALMSGGNQDSARHHILGIRPLITISSKGKHISIRFQDNDYTTTGDPFKILKLLSQRYAQDKQSVTPVSAGLLGYLSYDLKDVLEELPATSIDDQALPDLYMTIPSVLVVRDRHTSQDFICMPLLEGSVESEAANRLKSFKETLAAPSGDIEKAWRSDAPFYSPFTKETYIDAVQDVRNYIAAGDVYQVNMSQRFYAKGEGNPFELYAQLYRKNPAPFFAYLNPGDHQVLSTSPERFIELKRTESGERLVETRPIKGTRPRGKTLESDQCLSNELLCSPKDDAEISMIVDLLRNDIGKVCRARSVKVTQHKRLESYDNVHHLVSIVNGVLDDDKDAVDLIAATFPGGSITGCPKIRSMEIIEELEPVRRHIYTGSIGYISFQGSMDLSIAIRTATVRQNQICFSVGGGIVYDSEPRFEYEETLHKGETLMKAIGVESDKKSPAVNWVWCDGLIQPSHAVSVSIEDEGFLYGYGFFETLRVEKNNPVMLDRHINRLKNAWNDCFEFDFPDLTWKEIIHQVIKKNQLNDQVAAVKILACSKSTSVSTCANSLGYRLLVSARKYRHRLTTTIDSNGMKLARYPHSRHTHLADHKTMNYMFYKIAGSWARNRHADEALICNPDNTVSETNTANICFKKNGKWIFPTSDHVLSGTFQGAVIDLLRSWNEPIIFERIPFEDCAQYDAVFVSNSLMGVVPVTAIDELSFSPDEASCQRLNDALLYGQTPRIQMDASPSWQAR